MPGSDDPALQAARDLLRIEANAVLRQIDGLDTVFLTVADRIAAGQGATLVAGIGKSGLVARLLAGKLASVGARAWALDAVDALHGELGALRADDLLIVLSNSGQTRELVDLATAARSRGVKVAAMVARTPSALSRLADWTLKAHVEREATDTRLPTASTTAMLAYADALAIAVAQRLGFTADDFARNHPGGTLGVVLGARAEQLMSPAPDAVALVGPDQPVLEALVAMTRHPSGAALVVDADRRLLGLLTDGDIRRALASHGAALPSMPVRACMTANPRICPPDATAMQALERMETPTQVYVLPVVNADGVVLGLLRMHDIAGLQVEKALG